MLKAEKSLSQKAGELGAIQQKVMEQFLVHTHQHYEQRFTKIKNDLIFVLNVLIIREEKSK